MIGIHNIYPRGDTYQIVKKIVAALKRINLFNQRSNEASRPAVPQAHEQLRRGS